MRSHSAHANDCPCCHAVDTVERPSALWRWALVPAWLLILAACAGSALLGPTIAMVVPFLFGWAVCLLAALYDRAYALPTCRRCGKIAAWGTPGSAARARVEPAVSQAA